MGHESCLFIDDPIGTSKMGCKYIVKAISKYNLELTQYRVKSLRKANI